MLDYQFMQYRAEDLRRQAAHERLVREAMAGRRDRSGNRPGLLRRLADAVRPAAADAAPTGRLREC